jgi:NitT/TauT family transport system permease protein
MGFSHYFARFSAPLTDRVYIDLSLKNLPLYAFFSLSRGLLALAVSFLFSLLWGFWAAKDKVAEKFLIPLLDVLQSIPFLGFLPGVVLLLIGFFPKNNTGLELAAIIMMFTSQVWNMAFGVYQSIRTVPLEKNECATAFKFSNFQRFRWVELPFALLSLIWNSIMSMAGGWFFLMINEAFTLGNRDFRLPGLGSYMSVAASRGDVPSMLYAIIAMVALIVLINQLLWRPLVAWSQKLRVEEISSKIQQEAWFLNLLRNSYLIGWLRSLYRKTVCFCQNQMAKRKEKPDAHHTWAVASRGLLFFLFVLLTIAVIYLFGLIKNVSLIQWLFLSKMLLFTFLRVFLCVSISVLIMVPVGLAIGLSEKWCRLLEPIIQVTASFPATLLFPSLVLVFHLLGIPLTIGSIVLMLMGTQWYVLFNVIAGAKAMPSDLKEVATSFSFSRRQRFLELNIPAIFPYLITGILSASGGAWNASIVSEYVSYKGQVWTTLGIGSSISLAAQNNDFPLLAASVLLMVVLVVTINYQVWRRIYHYSEKRFALNE